MASNFVSADAIRTLFSHAMSDMYKAEVPQYGTLLEIVARINAAVLQEEPALAEQLRASDQLSRLDLERHGAIRVGTAQELFTIRRLFAVMGMQPVGYYDLTVAGVPVHSTAFRPVTDDALRRNPFRVFTSLLRLELIQDDSLRAAAEQALSRRAIFTPACLELIAKWEQQGGLEQDDAQRFVDAALETFRWHRQATVSGELYKSLRAAHPLIGDIVSFKGPHINHLTPRTLDIDRVQQAMPDHGIKPKAVIEGPARRQCPILLRQTSFLALNEAVAFPAADGRFSEGTHTARFGEIEQRGIALTPAGRRLYDEILDRVRQEVQPAGDGSNKKEYLAALDRHFLEFPDSYAELRSRSLAFFRYGARPDAAPTNIALLPENADALEQAGLLSFEPIIYEDFLPVSAAGIFQSNLGDENKQAALAQSNRQAFEAALGAGVLDELQLYAQAQHASLLEALARLKGHG
ncbi:VOC family protein [Herbaspirillum lusitanum]|uniref:2-oxoadipate dioxygenase/decarboxylase n=1 Tax=Herbaspirillum lusitanum TaxID=213312 RepID=A0ABW9AH64_9BURK